MLLYVVAVRHRMESESGPHSETRATGLKHSTRSPAPNPKKFEVTSEVVPGNHRETILDGLVNHEASLAVLGAKGLTGPERFQMGSVSEWVAAYSGCSILVVRPHIKRFVV